MQAPQRVHKSRSMGFSCVHSISNAPSQPAIRTRLPDSTAKLRSAGNSASPLLSVASTVTPSWPLSTLAQCSAGCSGPTISSWPSERYETAGTGSGSGKAAAASSAAIFGVPAFACADQPVISGAQPIVGWTLDTLPNIYRADLGAGGNAGLFPGGVVELFRNGQRLPYGRWPNLGTANGAAYILQRFSGNWDTRSYVKSSSNDDQDRFGSSAAIWGDTFVIGISRDSAQSGGAEVFR